MILITGAARSGTTLTSLVFKACGADFGDKCNTLLEDTNCKKSCKKRLSESGFDPLGQYPLPTPSTTFSPLNLSGISTLPPIVKEAKICLMWEIWHEAFPDAKWVLVRRDVDSLLDSLHRTPFMKAYENREGWNDWVQYHLLKLEEIRNNCNFVEVWPKEFKNGSDCMREAVEFCGLSWNEQEARKVIKKGLLK